MMKPTCAVCVCILNTPQASKPVLLSLLCPGKRFFAFMKPLNDLPISSMVGIFVATVITLAIAFLIPDSAVKLVENYVNPKIVLIVIFFIIFTVVAITVKFYTAGLMMASKFISWAPIAFIVSIISFIQAFMLLVMGTSLV